jgi:hypothetical protein
MPKSDVVASGGTGRNRETGLMCRDNLILNCRVNSQPARMHVRHPR